MKKKYFLIILFFCMNTNAQSLKLALNWKPEPQFGGFYAAEVEGIFHKKSLNIRIIPGSAGTPTIQAVSAGQAEFGIVSAEEVPVSRLHGSDIVALFAVYQTNPQSILAHAEDDFKSIKDIFNSNATFAVQKGLPFFLYLLKKLGKPQVKLVPSLGGITNFLTDPHFVQQGFATAEPLLIEKRGIKVKVFKISDEGFNPYLTVLVARKAFIEKNPLLVKKVVDAVREGWQIYLDQPMKTNGVMHRLNPSMDEATFQASSQAQKSFIETEETAEHGLGLMTQKRWEILCEQLKMVGAIRQVPDVKDLFLNL